MTANSEKPLTGKMRPDGSFPDVRAYEQAGGYQAIRKVLSGGMTSQAVIGEVKDATVVLNNGRTARVTMHLISGSKEEIENTFRQSIEAFFEMYPEI